jgi:D-glucosaminate-6-phosphate ammonia-lyase
VIDRPTPIINAAGPVTRLGGHRMALEVVEAMAAAAQSHHPIDELQVWAGGLIASATDAEAGWVTAGASSGLLLAAAACIARLDPARMDRLPDAEGLPREIIVQRGHRNAYDHAIRASGARMVEVGYEGYPGAGRTHPWQVAEAITAQTVAVFYAVLPSPGTLPLGEVSAIAHAAGVPVIVDAAASLPPEENLRRFIHEGADLVAFSGGKAIGGPQGSGILCGRADLIQSAALQHLDMDVSPLTWTMRDLIPSDLAGIPHHGIGRSSKVGKETIVGLMAALTRFRAQDHRAEERRQTRLLEGIAGGLRLPSSGVAIVDPANDFRGYPMLVVQLGSAGEAAEIANRLRAGAPRIFVGEGQLDQGRLVIVATTLADDEAGRVLDRLNAALAAHGEG